MPVERTRSNAIVRPASLAQPTSTSTTSARHAPPASASSATVAPLPPSSSLRVQPRVAGASTPLSLWIASKSNELVPPVYRGNVFVRSRDDLAKLAGIRSVDGDLFVDAPDVTEADLAALSIERISGDLSIARWSSPNLSFPSLRTVDGGLRVDCSGALVSLNGFDVERVGGLAAFVGNPSLASVDGLRLKEVGGLQIAHCDALRSLHGVETIAAMPMFLSLEDNASLSDISALTSLRSAGDVFLQQNPSLTDLGALDRLSILPSANPIVRNNGVTVDVDALTAKWKSNTPAPPASTSSAAPTTDAATTNATSTARSTGADIARAPWTFFVHLNADNNLETEGAQNLEDMRAVGSIPQQANVFALVDGYAGVAGDADWSASTRLVWIGPATNGQPGEVRVLDVDRRSDLGRMLADGHGELDLGDPAVLRAAVKYVQQTWPSDHFALDLWDHGRAWDAVSDDETSGRALSIARGELVTALEGLPIDVLAADACLEGSAEVADVAARLGATWFVGSEEVEPGSGWAYRALLERLRDVANANGSIDGADIARAIVDSYAAGSPMNATMSATRVDAVPRVRDAISALARAVVDAGGLDGNAALRAAYEATLRFGNLQLDVGDFAAHVLAAFPAGPLADAAHDVVGALADACVVGTGAPRSQYANARGLSAYGPTNGLESGYPSGAIPGWLDMVSTYFRTPSTRTPPPHTPAHTPPPTRTIGVQASDTPAPPYASHLAMLHAIEARVVDGVVQLRARLPDRPWRVFTSTELDAANKRAIVKLDVFRDADAATEEVPALLERDVALPADVKAGWTVDVVEPAFFARTVASART